MVLLFGLLDLFLFVSTAKSDPDSWGLMMSNIYQPPPRNFHKNFQKCDEMAGAVFRVEKAGRRMGIPDESGGRLGLLLGEPYGSERPVVATIELSPR
jgi:hypothetical protein